jgi:hypothetical protein
LAIHQALRQLFPANPALAYGWMTTRNRAFDHLNPARSFAPWVCRGAVGMRLAGWCADPERRWPTMPQPYADTPLSRHLCVADLQRAMDAVAPSLRRSVQPHIDQPFELAAWSAAIEWPSRTWHGSRFSDGGHGVRYGSATVATTLAEPHGTGSTRSCQTPGTVALPWAPR